ncbi:MAG: enoyl-CoA hydratase-related protein [Peptococcaceae bacterium]
MGINKEGIIKEEEGFVCTLTINRPAKRNSLNESTLLLLGDILQQIEAQKKLRVIVLRGAGESSFCAGVEVPPVSTGAGPPVKALTYCLESLNNCNLPVIAMVYGYVIGAGLDLVVCSDFCLAADSAFFAANLVKIGRIYYYEAAQRLLNLVGLRATQEILLSGSCIKAQRAGEIGLVNQVLPVAKLPRAVYELARELAEENSPLAMRGTKKMLKKLGYLTEFDEDTQVEFKKIIEQINFSYDAGEGQKAFLEKRKPVFKGE